MIVVEDEETSTGPCVAERLLVEIERQDLPRPREEANMLFVFRRAENGTETNVTYNSGLFALTRVPRLTADLRTILEAMVEDQSVARKLNQRVITE